MALYLTANIEIGKYRFRYAESVEIESTWRELSDTCKVRLPNLRGQLEKAISVGDKVKVQIGYDENNKVEFRGYVSDIKPKMPFEIICEDEMYQLKRGTPISKVYKSITLKALLQEIVPTAEISDSVPDMTLTNFVLNKATPAQALQKIKEYYLLVSYFRNGLLYVGLPYTESNRAKIKYDFQRNIISDDLTYRKKENVKLKAKAISILPNGAKVEVEVGDKEGEQRTLYFQGIADKTALESIATKELEKYKYEGYTGDFESFGLPFCQHSDIASITDKRYPERAGDYIIDKVVTTWGTGGFRRKIDLGVKVSV